MYYWMKNKTPKDFLEWLQNEINKRKEKERISFKEKEGAILVYKDTNWKVYWILNREASIRYGKGTKWCISGSKFWGASDYFNYYDRNNTIYFFIRKDDEKWALLVDKESNDYQIFNSSDNKVESIPNAPLLKELGDVSYSKEDSSDEDKLYTKLLLDGTIGNIFSYDWVSDLMSDKDSTYEFMGLYEDIEYFLDEVVDYNVPDGYLEYTNGMFDLQNKLREYGSNYTYDEIADMCTQFEDETGYAPLDLDELYNLMTYESKSSYEAFDEYELFWDDWDGDLPNITLWDGQGQFNSFRFDYIENFKNKNELLDVSNWEGDYKYIGVMEDYDSGEIIVFTLKKIQDLFTWLSTIISASLEECVKYSKESIARHFKDDTYKLLELGLSQEWIDNNMVNKD